MKLPLEMLFRENVFSQELQVNHPDETNKEFMKIYFAGSIRGGREDAAIYQTMIAWLQSFGEVLTEHVGDTSLSQAGDDGPDNRSIHDRDMAWLESCNCIVAEVTTPSLGVGYELGWAAAMKKPVLCLHRIILGRTLSAMIAGSPGIQTTSYASLDEAKTIVEEFLHNAIKAEENGHDVPFINKNC